MAGALIVAAALGPADFNWLDGERRRYFPPDRNQLDAHLTMFHALPPSLEGEARSTLKEQCNAPRPAATIAGLMNLGGGVAYRVVSPGLDAFRNALADHFHGSLTAQDAGGWRAHVTIQNKVPPARQRRYSTYLKETSARVRSRSMDLLFTDISEARGKRSGDGPFAASSSRRPRRN